MNDHLYTSTRRSMLSALGGGLAASAVGSAAGAIQSNDAEFVIAQGDACTPITPFQGEELVEGIYGYHLPERYVNEENGLSAGEPPFASAGTVDLQRPQTSIAFLYAGPNGLSLVVVHGSIDAEDAGSVTFDITGLPESGEWLVKDDLYRDPGTGEVAPDNYDRWHVEGPDHRIDWTWGSAGTDGGAFGHLGDDFEVVIDPAFNQTATLYNEHYTGTVTDWEFVSNAADGPEYIPLDMAKLLRIRPGNCEDVARTDTGNEQAGQREPQPEESDAESREEFTVCHRPPGNPDNAHTISVGSESAVETHLEHGDSSGPCSGNE